MAGITTVVWRKYLCNQPRLSIRQPFGPTRVLADDLRPFWPLLRNSPRHPLAS